MVTPMLGARRQEYCDRGNLDRAVSSGLFRRQNGWPDLVRPPLLNPAGSGFLQAGACGCEARTHPRASTRCTAILATLSMHRAAQRTWLPPSTGTRRVLSLAFQNCRVGGAQDGMLRCLIDIAAGMEYLHSLGVIHGDLKGANCLLKSTACDPRGFTVKARPCLASCARSSLPCVLTGAPCRGCLQMGMRRVRSVGEHALQPHVFQAP